MRYMEEHGEFIRFKHKDQDFYLYLSKEERPVVIDGKRQRVTVSRIKAFDRYQTPVSVLGLPFLFEKAFWLMRFDKEGEPIWDEEIEKSAH